MKKILVFASIILIVVIGSRYYHRYHGDTLVSGSELSYDELPLAKAHPPQFMGRLQHLDLNEVSGLAYSNLAAHRLFAINDSREGSRLFALDTQGLHLAEFTISGIENRDWEDMASFVYEGQAYLMIADVGNNNFKHEQGQIHILKEPTFTNPQTGQEETASITDLSVSWSLTFAYQDQPRDCEAVAVDSQQGLIYLLSKKTQQSIIYTLPLKPDNTNEVLEAKKIGTVSYIPKPNAYDQAEEPKWYHIRSRPTSLDFSKNHDKAVILTYKYAYLFEKTANQSWLDVLQTKPSIIKIPPLRAAEAISFDDSGQRLYVTSEKRPSPLVAVDLLTDSLEMDITPVPVP